MPNTREKRLVAYDPIAFGEFTQSLKNTLEVYDPYSDGYEDGVERIEDWLEFNAIVNGVTVQKWIPVAERLPEEDEGVVLVYSGGVEPAVISGGIFLEYDKYEGWPIDDVTHWMPLPQPPKGE